MEKYCANDGNTEITFRANEVFCNSIDEIGHLEVSWPDLNALFERKFNARTTWTSACIMDQRNRARSAFALTGLNRDV
jgi:hypothetical protein